MDKGPSDKKSVLRDHRRQWRDCLYVYPVISRRAQGLSIGVNLNPEKRCNFGCVYCQINRRVARGLTGVDLDRLGEELDLALAEATSGRLWEEPRYASTPPELRRINDIAFSGDGEPTCLAEFDTAVQIAADAKDKHAADDVKIVIITNATKLDSPQFSRALPALKRSNGEIWAKLDAGTEEHFRAVNRPAGGVTLDRIVSNIAGVATQMPVVIQTLFFRLDGRQPDAEEISAYIGRIRRILDSGGSIKLIQLHTIARSPAEAVARALPNEQLDEIAEIIRNSVPEVPLAVYYGQDVPPQSGTESDA